MGELGWERRELGVTRIDLRPVAGEPAGVGPRPLNRALAEAAADGVGMDIVDRLEDSLAGEQVSVVAGTFLPVTEGCLAGALVNGEIAQQPAA